MRAFKPSLDCDSLSFQMVTEKVQEEFIRRHEKETPSFINIDSLASAPVALINNLNVFSLESFFQLVLDELFMVA